MNESQLLLPSNDNFQMHLLDPNYTPSFDYGDNLVSGQQLLLDSFKVEEGFVPLPSPKPKKLELPCIVCPKVYVCKKFLQRHKTFHHHLCKPVQQLDCDHCGAIFADVDSHKTHLEETDNHLREFFSVGLPQIIKQQKRAEDLNALRKKTQEFQRDDEIELKEFFLQPPFGKEEDFDNEEQEFEQHLTAVASNAAEVSASGGQQQPRKKLRLKQ